MLARLNRSFPVFRLPNRPFGRIRPTLGGLRPREPQQVSPHHEQVRQRTGHEQAVGIFHETPVADLHETEDSLDHQKRMFALGTHSRLGGVLRFLFIGQGMVARALLVGEVLRCRRRCPDRRGLPGIGRRASR